MGVPTDEEEAKAMYPGTRTLSECERCKVKAQALCPFTSFGAGRLGMASGAGIGSVIPGIGTATGATAGTIAGFIGGMAMCQTIKNAACEKECNEENVCENDSPLPPESMEFAP